MPKPDRSTKQENERPAILLEECSAPLLASCPDSLVQSSRTVNQLVNRATSRSDHGSAVYQLTQCKEIDAGAILLLMHAGYRLASSGWRACVSGEGEAINLIARHLEHFLRARTDRDDCAREDGDYLLREIAEPDHMVLEIAHWAESVQQETNAKPEEVALWKFQISEVTTNGFQHGLGGLDSPQPLLVAGKSTTDAKTVQLAALDYGRSIPATIADSAAKSDVPDDDGKRIAFACKKGISSHRLSVNQGAGLFKLVETVKDNGGRLLILSRNGLFHVSNGRSFSRKLTPNTATEAVLQGTLVVVNLRIR